MMRKRMEKEKEEHSWRKEIFGWQMRRRKPQKEKEEIFREGGYFCCEWEKNGNGKGEKYLGKENIFLRRKRKTEKERDDNKWRGEMFGHWRRRRTEKEKEENI